MANSTRQRRKKEAKDLTQNRPGQLSTLPLLKITQALLIVGVTLGVAFLVYSSPLYAYDFGLNASGAGMNVRFVHWSDGTFSNTVSLNYNIYADVTTYDSNATYGIANTAGKAITVILRIGSITNTGKVANVTLTILSQDGTQQVAKMSWTGGDALPTPDQTFIAAAQTDYLLQVSIRGASSVVAGDLAGIGLHMSTSG